MNNGKLKSDQFNSGKYRLENTTREIQIGIYKPGTKNRETHLVNIKNGKYEVEHTNRKIHTGQ